MRPGRFRLRGVAWGLLALMALPTAGAHAYLEAGLTRPGPDTHLDTAPASVRLVFTENLETQYTNATILDGNGTRVETTAPRFPDGEPNVMEIPLPALPDGIYTVQWHTLSVDTHTATGSYLFAVGNASLTGTPSPIADHDHAAGSWAPAFAKTMLLAGLLLSIGLPFFALVVDPRRPIPVGMAHRLAMLGGVAAAAAAAAAALRVVDLAATVQASIPNTVLSTTTGPPLAWAVGGLAFAAIGFLRLDAPAPSRRAWALPAAGGIVALAGTALASHAAALVEGRALALLTDAVHLLAASVWVGGIVGFVASIPGRSIEDNASLVRRFSPWAMASVAALLLTGAYASFLHLRSWSDLWRSAYGIDISTKVALLGALAALGAWNQRRVGPALQRGQDLRGALHRSTVTEALLLAAVLVVSGLLSTTAPPEAEAAAPGPAPALDELLQTVHVIAYVEPQPVRLGIQHFTVQLHPLRSDRVGEGASVYLQFQAPGAGPPDELVGMQRASDIEWTLVGGRLTSHGDWTVHVLVQTPQEYAKRSFTVTVT